jgi:8-oxo-dGTP diphosphatase
VTADPVEVARGFNDRIGAHDLDGLAALMTDDHAFVDTEGATIEGRSACVEAWRGFFDAFPDYRNVFVRVSRHGAEVVAAGHSLCAEPALAGQALWQARIRAGRVARWQVYDDTVHNRRALGLSTLDAGLAARHPLLFAPQTWRFGGIEALFSVEPPPDELVTNVHVIGFVGDRLVVCRDERPVWFLPGGTRDAGESVRRCADRELMEEAGARLVGPLRGLGAHHLLSGLPGPRPPHHPHPETAWLWCAAEVELVGPPTVPEGGERVVEVRLAEPAEAARLLRADTNGCPTWSRSRSAAPDRAPAPVQLGVSRRVRTSTGSRSGRRPRQLACRSRPSGV